MIALQLRVIAQGIEVLTSSDLVSGSVEIYTAEFEFNDAWTGFTKTALFDYVDGNDPTEVVMPGTSCTIPWEPLEKHGYLRVGVCGVNGTQVMPTVWTELLQIKEGAVAGSIHIEPTGTTYEQVMAILAGIDGGTGGQILAKQSDVDYDFKWVDNPAQYVPGTEGDVVVIGSNSNISDSGVSKDNLLIAPQLASNNYKTDSVPYIYRQTGGGIGTGNREYDSIVGGSVAWNQMIDTPTFKSTNTDTRTYVLLVLRLGSSPYTLAIPATDITTTGVFNRIFSSTFTGNAQIIHSGRSANQYFYNGTKLSLVNGHKYLLSMNFTGIDLSTVGGVTIKDMFCLDLTQMFGSAVADRLYAMEQASAGSGIAVLNAMGLNQYSPYTATPSLESVSGLQKHQMKDADGNVIAEYPLDSSLTLRGVAVIDDNNNIKFDGDEYAPDGTVTRKRGVVDLGTLTWTTVSSGNHRAVLAGAYVYANGQTAKAICTHYLASSANLISTVDKQFCIGINSSAYIIIHDEALSNIDDASFKTAMSGIMVDYRLATPTTETAEPYDSLQICDPLGTEEYVTTGICPVGHVTQYPENQVAKLDGLPSDFSTLIAPTEKAFTATRAYTTGRLLIVNNILYKATTSIASGATLTVGTNIVAITLDEVIASL